MSFLGLGVQPPTPSLGRDDRRGPVLLRSVVERALPGLAIVLAVLSFNFIGDGLRDALDPQQRVRA